jgi:hypothetical protein
MTGIDQAKKEIDNMIWQTYTSFPDLALRLTPWLTSTIAPIFDDIFHHLTTHLKIHILFVYHCLQ